MRLSASCLVALLLSATITGCSSEQTYNASQGWKQQECEKIRDDKKRQDCLDAANQSYRDYREGKAPAGRY